MKLKHIAIMLGNAVVCGIIGYAAYEGTKVATEKKLNSKNSSLALSFKRKQVFRSDNRH